MPLAAWSQGDKALTPIRVGVLEFGTVSWELDVIQARDLARKRGIDLKVIALASGDASAVALQGGAVDMIVTDWIWVSRQRADSHLFTFAPYSNAVGSVMVQPGSAIRQVSDLRDKRLGIAGGPTDKSWLFLRAYAQRKLGVDLTRYTQPTLAAPPLLTDLALRGQLDAVLNAWNYAARLEMAGMHSLIDVPEMLRGLGIDKPIPLLGWVFREDWAAANGAAVKAFLDASFEAKAVLAQSDTEWDRLRPRMRAPDDAVFKSLRSSFRSGIPTCTDQDTMAAVGATFRVLAETGGERLVGKSTALSAGTF
ncbi:MAG: ABC transporter substrate-binding protein, partial [Rhodoferax sp.]